MTGTGALERRCRRWLKWYPRSFRSEYEAEILGMLMDSVPEGRRRPEPMVCLDLVVSAVRVRLQPRVARSERSVFAAIRVMWVGAVAELLTVVMLVATMTDVRVNARNQNPAFTAQQWHAAVATQIDPNVIGGLVAIGFWACMAWSIGRGHRWTRVVFPAFFVLNLCSLLEGVLHGAASTSPPDLGIAVVLCLIELMAVILLFRSKVVTHPLSFSASPAMITSGRRT